MPASHHRSTPALCAATVLMLLASVLPAQAQVAETIRLFDEGNARYAQGDYRGALAAYEGAAEAGYVGGALYYNMGNAYYRIDQIGQAIRYYEKARRLLPDRPELLHNIEIAQARTTDRFSRLPEPFWRPWWRALLHHAGAGGLFGAGLVLYLAAVFLFGHRLWTGTRTVWHRRAMAACTAAGLALLALAFAASLDRQLDRRAVVTATAVGLHDAPLGNTPAALDVHEGLLLDVLEERDAWLHVRLPNGATGWIEAGAVAPI